MADFDASKHPRNAQMGRPGHPTQFTSVAKPEGASMKLSEAEQAIQRMYDQVIILRDAQETAGQVAVDAMIAARRRYGAHELIFRRYDGGDGSRLVFVGVRDEYGDYSQATDGLYRDMSEAGALIPDGGWENSEPAFYTEDGEHFYIGGDRVYGKIRQAEIDSHSEAVGGYLTNLQFAPGGEEAIIDLDRETAEEIYDDIVAPSLDAIVYSIREADEITVNPAASEIIAGHISDMLRKKNLDRYASIFYAAYERAEVDDDEWMGLDADDFAALAEHIEDAERKLRDRLI